MVDVSFLIGGNGSAVMVAAKMCPIWTQWDGQRAIAGQLYRLTGANSFSFPVLMA